MYSLMRLISLILVVIALMLMGGDIVSSLEHHGQIVVRSVGQVWDLLQPNGSEAYMAWNSVHLPGFLAQGIAIALGFWSWLVIGGVGIVLAFIFGRKQETAA